MFTAIGIGVAKASGTAGDFVGGILPSHTSLFDSWYVIPFFFFFLSCSIFPLTLEHIVTGIFHNRLSDTLNPKAAADEEETGKNELIWEKRKKEENERREDHARWLEEFEKRRDDGNRRWEREQLAWSEKRAEDDRRWERYLFARQQDREEEDSKWEQRLQELRLKRR